MEAQVWTLVGLLTATLVSSFFYLGNKIDGSADRLESKLGSRIDGVGSRLIGRTDRLEGRMDSRIDALTGEVRAQGARIDGLSARVEDLGSSLGSQIYELGAQMQDHLRRHAG